MINPKVEKEKRERVLELIGEVPHVRIDPGENRKGSGADPNVDESVRVAVWYSWVSSVRVSKILLHFSRALSLTAIS